MTRPRPMPTSPARWLSDPQPPTRASQPGAPYCDRTGWCLCTTIRWSQRRCNDPATSAGCRRRHTPATARLGQPTLVHHWLNIMKTYAKALIGLSFLGTLNALCLTSLFVRTKWAEHVSSVCDINSYASCTSVITNPHALFLGVPVCSIALIVYPVLIGLGFAALKRQRTRDIFYAASILSAMGLMLN